MPPAYAKMVLMQRLSFYSLLALAAAALSLPASPAYAQRALGQGAYNMDDIQDQAYLVNPQYEAMARNAMMYMADSFSFNLFRLYYAQTRQYDPISDDTIGYILQLAYEIQTTDAENPEYQKALDRFELTFINHMANLGVVLNVLALARDDPRFGDVEFLEWLRDGLIDNLMVSGNGETLRDAYDVITPTEESVLFERLELKHISTQPAQEYNTYYNMHEVEDINGERFTLFVNTSWPMKYLTKRAKFEGR